MCRSTRETAGDRLSTPRCSRGSSPCTHGCIPADIPRPACTPDGPANDDSSVESSSPCKAACPDAASSSCREQALAVPVTVRPCGVEEVAPESRPRDRARRAIPRPRFQSTRPCPTCRSRFLRRPSLFFQSVCIASADHSLGAKALFCAGRTRATTLALVPPLARMAPLALKLECPHASRGSPSRSDSQSSDSGADGTAVGRKARPPDDRENSRRRVESIAGDGSHQLVERRLWSAA